MYPELARVFHARMLLPLSLSLSLFFFSSAVDGGARARAKTEANPFVSRWRAVRLSRNFQPNIALLLEKLALSRGESSIRSSGIGNRRVVYRKSAIIENIAVIAFFALIGQLVDLDFLHGRVNVQRRTLLETSMTHIH